MMDDTRRRALITFVVAAIPGYLGFAGVGHAYLRQWRRSLVWFLLGLGSAIALLFYHVEDPGAIDIGEPAAVPTEVTIPLLIIITLSVLDAVFLSISLSKEQGEQEARMDAGADPETAAQLPTCPNCGKEVDPELDFCPWCTIEFERPPEEEPAGDRRP